MVGFLARATTEVANASELYLRSLSVLLHAPVKQACHKGQHALLSSITNLFENADSWSGEVPFKAESDLHTYCLNSSLTLQFKADGISERSSGCLNTPFTTVLKLPRTIFLMMEMVVLSEGILT